MFAHTNYDDIPEKYRSCPFCGEPLVILATDYSEICPQSCWEFVLHYRCKTSVTGLYAEEFDKQSNYKQSKECRSNSVPPDDPSSLSLE